eukprot:TRINITY_DN163_c0_g1_i1.p1 TRINITY_DN163_c0_g1~~TRINITY_DN163_c0_g1_i1.p1  ORF type:complete len:230 (-),score=52.85 TRINITY_DN163_c0_g1_i1:29-718(-)
MEPLLEGYDAEQVRLMEEECILVSEDDKVIGHDSKKNCHLNANIFDENGPKLLHRAFSVFLFNNEGKLLLQQRSKDKITFALDWTNTCCSHPLYTPSELEEEAEIGVRRAAQRKLEQELGIVAADVPLDSFKCVGRIHYKSPSNDTWGEHEVDYILIIQTDVKFNRNPNEVEDTKWVSQQELSELIAKPTTKLTPWFNFITKDGMLHKWWDNLHRVTELRDMTIKRFTL